MTTKSTPAAESFPSSGNGSKSGPASECTLEPPELLRPGGPSPESLVGRELEARPDQRPVEAVVDRLRRELQLLSHQVEQRRERRHRRRHETALDPRDRGLRRARTASWACVSPCRRRT
jgi:hypothetical protein